MSKTVQIRLVAGIAICLLALSAEAKYGGGTGEPNDPYQIATADDLIALGETPDHYDKHFILTADIDLDPNLPGVTVFDRAVIAPDTNDADIWEFDGISFTGVFDGNNHTISHLTITGKSHLGLFGQLGSGANISNLGLEAVDVNGTGDYVGGLVGSNYEGVITTSYSTGTVTGNNSVGGLVGQNGGSITTSYSTGTVSGNNSVGGLVGENFLGSIATSYSTGSVTGNENVGGLVGEGFGSITTSFWDMETSGQATSAGGTGLTTAEMQDIKTYLSAGWDFVDEIVNGTCNYWRISSGDYPRLRYPVMPEGLGTAQEPYLIRDARDLGTVWFKPSAHYRLEASVDLSGITWSMAVIPWFEGTFDGNGYVISNLHIQGREYLGLFGQLGYGAEISNLGLEAVDVNGTDDYVGGLVGRNGEFYSEGGGILTNCYSTGTVSGGWYVGGLVGRNQKQGSIAASYSSGTVTGYTGVGGLVGRNWYGSITTSYSTGMVGGDRRVGGLVGDNAYGSITTSYSTGMVGGDRRVGGLVGYNYGNITTSYSTGTVSGSDNYDDDDDGDYVGGFVGMNQGSIAASFWDLETSGLPSSNGGIGKTTAEMQTAGTFLDAGWGCDPVWTLDEGRDYPRLWWENAPGEPIMYTLYVDDDAPEDPGPGDPQISDPLEDGRQAHPFDTIQEAIDVAPDCSTVLVRPGQYLKPQNDDTIDFLGKNITLRSSDPTNWDTVNSTVIRGSVQFGGTENSNCRLTGFRIHDPHYGAIYGNNTRATISYCVISGNGPCGATVIKDCDGTISNCLITDNTTFFFCGILPVVSGCDGLIKNCTIANNISGVSVGTATIENCIIYNNADSQLGVNMGETLSISYSNVQGGLEAIAGDGDVVWGPGNIDMDPRFVRLGYWSEEPLELTEGDYHLRSEGWHWNTEGESWTYDYVTSPCIDAGDPDSPLSDELLSVPRDPDNEYGVNLRINMGAFGGTRQASMPPLGWAPLADLNNEGRVDLKNIVALAENWLQIAGWVK